MDDINSNEYYMQAKSTNISIYCVCEKNNCKKLYTCHLLVINNVGIYGYYPFYGFN